MFGFEKMFVSLQCTAMCRDRVSDRVPPRGRLSLTSFFYLFQFHIIGKVKENSSVTFSACFSQRCIVFRGM